MPIDSSPWALGVFAQALLAAPANTLAVLPSGSLRLEKLCDLTLGAPEHAKRVGTYALWGLGTEPALLLLDEQGRFFGTMLSGADVTVREGYESHAAMLSQLATELDTELVRQVSARLTHRYDRPVVFRNVRVFDSVRAELSRPTNVIVFRDRIVGMREEVESDIDAVAVDGGGGTLLPALTDMHSHSALWNGPLHCCGRSHFRTRHGQ